MPPLVASVIISHCKQDFTTYQLHMCGTQHMLKRSHLWTPDGTVEHDPATPPPIAL